MDAIETDKIKKYEVLNELTDKLLESFDNFNDAATYAHTSYKQKKTQALIIRETQTNKIITRFGVLND